MRLPIRLTLLTAASLAIVASVALFPGDGSAVDSETSAFIGLVNMYRAQNGVPALQSNSGMNAAAQFLAEDNAERNVLSLIDSLQRNTSERLTAYGVSTSSRYETVPYGYAQGAGLFYSYMENPNHPVTQALCQPKYNAIGVGRTFQDPENENGASYGWVWTVTIAKLSGSQTSNDQVQCEPLIVPTDSPPATQTTAPTSTPMPTGTPTASPTSTPVPTGATATPNGSSTATPTPPPPTIEPSATPVATTTPVPTPPPTGAPKLAGDTDCDFSVGSLDALQVLREKAGMPDVPACIDAGDIDCDGDRDSVDALGILRFTASLPVNQPPTCPPIGWPI